MNDKKNHLIPTIMLLHLFVYDGLIMDIGQMIELGIFPEHTVQEVDVLRSREMIKRHTGKYGTLCFVVRRPG